MHSEGDGCPPAKEGGERSERVVVFGLRKLLGCGHQRTTTPCLRHFPSFAGGELEPFQYEIRYIVAIFTFQVKIT